ncbi:hypothetical protein MRB53_029751 [Persea americana]|uniref:Uncharacterized protein n=1 Tax=Persea americana TaxID=3435 RepID=A0ACC2KJ82_PERAE|nr:hypothetical protein MRB53_029751 [Persea americana]
MWSKDICSDFFRRRLQLIFQRSSHSGFYCDLRQISSLFKLIAISTQELRMIDFDLLDKISRKNYITQSFQQWSSRETATKRRTSNEKSSQMGVSRVLHTSSLLS